MSFRNDEEHHENAYTTIPNILLFPTPGYFDVVTVKIKMLHIKQNSQKRNYAALAKNWVNEDIQMKVISKYSIRF